MIEHRLLEKSKTSRRAAHELRQLMSKEGNHHSAFTSDASVREFFKSNGYDYDNLVQAVRDYPEPIPLVENYITYHLTRQEGLCGIKKNEQNRKKCSLPLW